MLGVPGAPRWLARGLQAHGNLEGVPGHVVSVKMAAVDRGPGDAALWSRAAHGDYDAFGQIFDRHAGAVYSYLFRLTANWSEAEDLTSGVFLQAWRRRAEVVIDRDSSLPWLLGVARCLAQNSRRARRRYQAALARAPRTGPSGCPSRGRPRPRTSSRPPRAPER